MRAVQQQRPMSVPHYLRLMGDDEPTPQPEPYTLPAVARYKSDAVLDDGEPITPIEHACIWLVILAFCVFDVALVVAFWRAVRALLR